MRRTTRLLIVVGIVLAAAVPAVAHVEVEPAPNGTLATQGEIMIVVPTESATADTISVAVRLPPNVVQATFPKVAGWNSTATTAPLAEPVQVAGQVVTTRVSVVTWTGGRIAPGARAEFRLRVRVRAGSTRRGLAFPAVQRYSDGTVVRWIGAPGSQNPAGVLRASLPVVAVSAAPEPETPTPVPGDATVPTPAPTTTSTATPPPPNDEEEGLGGLWVAIIAAAVAVVGGGAFALARRRRE